MLSEIKNTFKKTGEVYLRMKVRPGAHKSEIKSLMSDGTIKIDIAAPPVGGRANSELIKFLAGEFDVDRICIKVISGAGEKTKLIKIKK